MFLQSLINLHQHLFMNANIFQIFVNSIRVTLVAFLLLLERMLGNSSDILKLLVGIFSQILVVRFKLFYFLEYFFDVFLAGS